VIVLVVRRDYIVVFGDKCRFDLCHKI
jgi:hypothetical protein